MNYKFSEEEFKKNFIEKQKGSNGFRIKNTQGIRCKIFPYDTRDQIVTDMKDIIGTFIQKILGIESVDTHFDQIVKFVKEEVDANEDDQKSLLRIIKSQFYKNGQFFADQIGLFAYQSTIKKQHNLQDKQEKNFEKYRDNCKYLAEFFHDIFHIENKDRIAVETAIKNYSYNALESLIIAALRPNLLIDDENNLKNHNYSYFSINKDVSEKFRKDFHFMLRSNMTTEEDLANLLALYYFYYTSQITTALDRFGEGLGGRLAEWYFAFDQETTSMNRPACNEEGWKGLKKHIDHIFCHAITLELLNQIEDKTEIYDYQKLYIEAEKSKLEDEQISLEINKIEKAYLDVIGDNSFSNNQVKQEKSKNKTDLAMRNLFNSVEYQLEINKKKRKSAYGRYVGHLTNFYKARWLKNRKKAGLVLNLTESDIIFLTKISLQDKDRIRLIDLFNEYENRGIFLDNTSKTKLQDFFTRLNLLDKKSDSGDAQYVKRIL